MGYEGQLRLKRGSVLVLGAGGLGCPALLYLAAAGVGRIGIMDADVVSASNLQRQILFTPEDIGTGKAASAARRLRALYPEIEVSAMATNFTAGNAMDALADYGVLLDGTDNFPTRYLAGDCGVWSRKPVVHASVHQWEGQVTVFAPHLGSPCYRCMFPVPPRPGTVPDCNTAGVMGATAGLMGNLQAAEAIKLLTGAGDPLLGRLLHVDSASMRFREFKLRRDPQCPVCGSQPVITAPVDYEGFCGMQTGPVAGEILPAAYASSRQNCFVLDVREGWEHALLPFHSDAWIPLERMEDEWKNLPADRRVLVICRVGLRSAAAAELLRGKGFLSVQNLAGGLEALEGVSPGTGIEEIRH